MKASLAVYCLIIAAVSAQHGAPAQMTPHMIRRSTRLISRQDGLAGIFGGTNDNSTDVTQTPTSVSSTTLTTATPTTSSTSTSTTPTSTSTSSTSTQPTSTSTSYRSTVTAVSSTSSSSSALASTVFTTETLAPASSTSVAAASSTAAAGGGSSHTGLIVGVSVVGGVAILGALIFLWMKFGGKRFSDYQDEDADIKWPELKTDGESAAMQPLPARRTGGAGFDMGNEFDEGIDGDGQSMAEYGNIEGQSMAGSTVALNAGVGAGAAAGYGAGTYGSAMEGYHDDSPSATNHYAQQPVVAGYYDPYSSSAYPSDQPQSYYPEQGAANHHDSSAVDDVPNPHQSAQYEDYANYSTDPYAAARAQAASTSPRMAPYRVDSQNARRGF